MAIKQLPTVSTLSADDIIPVSSDALGNDAKVPLPVLVSYVAGQLGEIASEVTQAELNVVSDAATAAAGAAASAADTANAAQTASASASTAAASAQTTAANAATAAAALATSKADALNPAVVTSGDTLTRAAHFNRPLSCAGGTLTVNTTGATFPDFLSILNTSTVANLTATAGSLTVTAGPGKELLMTFTGAAFVDPTKDAAASLPPATIAGTAGVGNVLTATIPALPANTMVSKVQWTRRTTGSTAAPVDMAGANSLTYTQQLADNGYDVGIRYETATLSTFVSVPVVVARTVAVGTEWVAIPNLTTQAGPYDTVVFRSADTIGSGDITHIGLGFANFAFANSTTGFVAASAFTFSQCHVSITAPNSTTYTANLTWDSGAATKAVAGGATVGSDVVSISTLTGGAYTTFPLGTVVYFDGLQSCAVGGGVTSVAFGVTSTYAGRTTSSARIYSSASGAAPTGLGSGGAVNASGSSAAWHIPRVFAIGKFASTASVSVLEFGDSIPTGVGDPGNPANDWTGGYAHRGRHVGAYGTGKIAGLRLTSSSTTALALNTNGAFAYGMLPFANALAGEMGRNTTGDETGERAAEMSMLNAAYDAGIRAFVRVAMFPTASSTDSWATTANQTPNVTYSNTREAWQQSIYTAGAAVRGKYNYWCDVPSVRAGTITPDRWKWAANGTANAYAWDSIHPSSGGHTAAGVDYRATLLTVIP